MCKVNWLFDSRSQSRAASRPAPGRTHRSEPTRTRRSNRPLHQRSPLERWAFLRHLPCQRSRIQPSRGSESNNTFHDDSTSRFSPRSPNPDRRKRHKHHRTDRNFHAARGSLRAGVSLHAVRSRQHAPAQHYPSIRKTNNPPRSLQRPSTPALPWNNPPRHKTLQHPPPSPPRSGPHSRLRHRMVWLRLRFRTGRCKTPRSRHHELQTPGTALREAELRNQTRHVGGGVRGGSSALLGEQDAVRFGGFGQ